MVNVNTRQTPAIYALHAGDHQYFYVGTTTVNSDNRLYEHIYRARVGHRSPVYVRMREVGIDNVQVVDLERLTDVSKRFTIEAQWIAKMIAAGHPIQNRIGRDGLPNSMSEESRALISAAHVGVQTWITGKRGEEAGWTQARREAMRARAAERRANRVPRHGTLSEYQKYGCRCDECFAVARHPRVPVEVHGRYLYKRDKCRCDVCVQANRDYLKIWSAARKAS